MKAIIVTIIATLISAGVAGSINFFITAKEKRKGAVSRKKVALQFVICWLVLFILGGVVYFNIYYHATANAQSYMAGTDEVSVINGKNYYLFDGEGEDTAVIFYQGAKVDEKAYAGIMMSLAEGGVDAFLVKMPLNMAFMGKNKAESIIEENSAYEHWYIAGHSLGGAMAGIFAGQHPELLDGIIFLASYSTMPISDELKVVSIVASEDKVLKWDVYYANSKNLPEDAEEIMIEGGNHSQFGDYGFQKGDGEAAISMEEQQSIVTQTILDMVR